MADLPNDDETCDEFKSLAASDGMLLGDETQLDIKIEVFGVRFEGEK